MLVYFIMKQILSTLLLFFTVLSFAQEKYDPLAKPNTYRNADNPNYWKNKMPHAAYWQQDVHYRIKADIDETTDIISGDETLIYWNNSPNNLDFVYFHLYQNAFQPDSYFSIAKAALEAVAKRKWQLAKIWKIRIGKIRNSC